MERPVCAICGQNPVFPAERLGCGKPIYTCAEVYRCTDCMTPFHRDCARRHFEQHVQEIAIAETPNVQVEGAEGCLQPEAHSRTGG